MKHLLRFKVTIIIIMLLIVTFFIYTFGFFVPKAYHAQQQDKALQEKQEAIEFLTEYHTAPIFLLRTLPLPNTGLSEPLVTDSVMYYHTYWEITSDELKALALLSDYYYIWLETK